MTTEPFTVRSGRREATVTEYDDAVGISTGGFPDKRGLMLPPAEAVAYAAHILEAAANVLNRQFQRQMGGP